MYKKLARIGPISCGLFYALMFLFFFLLMLLLSFVLGGDVVLQMMMGGMPMPAGEGMPASADVGSMGMMPILYGVGGSLIGGFITGLLTALVYNLIALFTGGIKIKTTDLAYDDI